MLELLLLLPLAGLLLALFVGLLAAGLIYRTGRALRRMLFGA